MTIAGFLFMTQQILVSTKLAGAERFRGAHPKHVLRKVLQAGSLVFFLLGYSFIESFVADSPQFDAESNVHVRIGYAIVAVVSVQGVLSACEYLFVLPLGGSRTKSSPSTVALLWVLQLISHKYFDRILFLVVMGQICLGAYIHWSGHNKGTLP